MGRVWRPEAADKVAPRTKVLLPVPYGLKLRFPMISNTWDINSSETFKNETLSRPLPLNGNPPRGGGGRRPPFPPPLVAEALSEELVPRRLISYESLLSDGGWGRGWGGRKGEMGRKEVKSDVVHGRDGGWVGGWARD